MIAKFWNTIPFALRGLPSRELRIMAEGMRRIQQAEQEAIDAARSGMPARGKPKPGDEIVERPRSADHQW